MKPEVESTKEKETISGEPSVITMTTENLLKYADKFKAVGNDIALIFDIDGCLYSNRNGLVELERKYITDFYNKLAENRNCLDFDTAFGIVGRYQEMFHKYLDLEPAKFMEFHFSFDFNKFLKEDPELRRFLDGLSVRKWCFTNGSKRRALTALNILGIRECFEGIFCLDEEAKDFVFKPMPESYGFVTKILGIESPKNVHFFDDLPENVAAAKQFGWNAYRIDEDTSIIDAVKKALELVPGKTPIER